MAYTVKQVAKMSGVSVRTLHFYDETGLLKPAYHGANGYRFYEEPQLLTLQQILFYRELGFELKQIKRILGRPEFEKLAALESHRKVLRKDLTRTRALIATIDKTIEHLKGTKPMQSHELFAGFNPEVQAKHEQYLIDRYGEGAKEGIAQSKARVKHWTKADWEKSGAAFNSICRDLAEALAQKQSADSSAVRAIIRRHHTWLKQFWTPTRESYAGHAQLIVDSELRKPYEAHHPQLPEFAAAGIQAFAERELS
jgi:DNA-binding transcriptional MerR regulator